MLSKLKDSLHPRHLGLFGLCLLALAYLSLFRYDNYGIEESAALDILLNWSIVHQIASPVAFFGMPDLRAVMFIPLDMHWVGSLIAVKVFTMYLLFGTALMMYSWSARAHSGESSMMASSLLLLSPISVMQTDAIGSGIYLLFCFVVLGNLNRMVHDSDRILPSWFFLQMLVAALAVSLHPMGLAVPLALAIYWLRDASDRRKTIRMIASIGIVTLFMLFLRWGWYGIDDTGSNLFSVLGDSLLGSPLIHPPGEGFGILIAALLIGIIGVHAYRRINDPVALMLIAASLIGTLHADHAWAFIAWATTLYLGLPLLIELNGRMGKHSLVGQRGLLLVVVFIIATLSMSNTRQLSLVAKNHMKTPEDAVISVLADESADPNKPFIAASQWPARTLLVCRRDVLPLPTASKDFAKFNKQVTGLTHIAFNPRVDSMHDLARNAAALNGFETIALMHGGVVLKAKAQDDKNKLASPHHP